MSDENHDFDAIGLDEIIQLSQVDNDHAPEIREQARAAADLYARVDAAITQITKAADNISASEWGAVGAAFEGESGDATRKTVRKLFEATGSAGTAMEPQSAVFAGLADRAETTHRSISRLRTDRDHWLSVLTENPKDPELNREFGGWFGEADPKQLETEIRRRYDADARDTMATHTSGYLTEVERLRTVGSYHGPRRSRPDSGGHEYHPDTEYRPGPTLYGPHSSDGSSATVPAAHHAPAVDPGASTQPELQSGAPAPAPPTPGPVAAPPASEVFVPTKPVVPPVIGARPTIAPAKPAAIVSPKTGALSRPVIGSRPSPAPLSTPSRQPGGLSRPVIGSQPGSSASRSAPTRQPGGLSRPVIGSQPGTTTSRSAPTRQPGGLSRPVIGTRPNAVSPNGSGPTSSRSTPPSRPGVRSTPAPTGASARSTGGPARQATGNRPGSSGTTSPAARPSPPANGAGPDKPKPGVRAGSGRTDTAPRGRVIGRASVPPSSQAKQPPASDTNASPQSDWYPPRATVPPVIHGAQGEQIEAEIDPGEHLTRDNLGKNRGDHDDQP